MEVWSLLRTTRGVAFTNVHGEIISLPESYTVEPNGHFGNREVSATIAGVWSA